MSWLERALLAVAISEIPLQVDKYFLYQSHDAEFGAVAGINVSLATFCLIALYGMWIVKSVANPVRLYSDRLISGGALPLYVLMIAASTLYATNPLLAVCDLAVAVQAYMFYFYLANRLVGADDIKFVLGVLAVSLFTQAVIVIALWCLSGGTASANFSIGPVQMMIFEDGRPCGTLFSPTLAGSYLAMLIIPSTVLAMVTVSRLGRWLSFLFVITGIVGLGLTQTRGAIFGAIVAGAIFGILLVRQRLLSPRKVMGSVIVLILISALPAIQLVKRRVLAGDQGSAASRVYLGKIALRAIAEHPLLGVGAGNCHLAMQDLANTSQYRGEWFYVVHSKYLLVWLETGLIGLLLLLTFIGDTLRRSWLAFRFGDRVVALAALALGASIVGHLLHMSIDMFNSRPQVQFFWTCAGIVAATHRISGWRSASPAPARVRPSLHWAGG